MLRFLHTPCDTLFLFFYNNLHLIVAGSRTPHYGSQTPLHEGNRTPSHGNAWDPTNANTPARFVLFVHS